MSTKFASDGFDLDAMAETENDDVIYEIGGGATVVPDESNAQEEKEALSGIEKAEEWKQQGNEQFKKGSYLEACDLYTEAIEACPGELKGDEILRKRDDFNEIERTKAFSRQRVDEETRRNRKEGDSSSSPEEKKEPEKPKPLAEFKLQPQPHGEKLAVYYCNRAAALIQMERYDDAITDCDVSTLLYPKYAKALVRRSSAYEKSDNTEDALRDAKKAQELDPTNATLRKSVARLQKIEDERLEKLKDETMGKLKDLGNSLLGNFGLSLDNFQAVQDPNTGSYSINFNQGAK
jgi:tetratricopeptide (TPR) repeat protein